MRTLLFLICAFFSSWSAIASTSHERLCGAETHGAIGRWAPFDDRSLRRYAEEFLRNTEAYEAKVIFCVNESPGATAWGMLLTRETGGIVIIGVGRRFVQAMGREMRPVIAHEVAHLTVDTRASEHAIDLISIRWVGKHATVASLREAIRFLEWEAAHQQIMFGGISELKKRLALLEELAELE